ncbi:MAG: transposase [Bacteroidales bacterium]|nr:transposase [Bacteroidales bacterium]
MPYNPTIHHRRSIRLKNYDYSQSGIYFVTICAHVGAYCIRPDIFGTIENGEMILNDAGQIAFNEWMKTPDIRSNIQLDAFVVMPNHIHGIIIITDIGRGVSHTPICDTPTLLNGTISATDVCDGNLGVCNGNQGVCGNISVKGVCDTPLRSPSNTVGAIVRGYKSAVTKQIGYSVWQRNYHEHIIRNKKSYQYIANYIVNNLANWEKDEFYTA